MALKHLNLENATNPDSRKTNEVADSFWEKNLLIASDRFAEQSALGNPQYF
jgi:hypothetical protein